MLEITCYAVILVLGCFFTCRDFLSILQAWSSHVLTVSILVFFIFKIFAYLKKIQSNTIFVFFIFFCWFQRMDETNEGSL